MSAEAYQRNHSGPYVMRHNRVRDLRGSPSLYLCEQCFDRQAEEWATIHGRDGENPLDYEPMCRRCHRKYDAHRPSECLRGHAFDPANTYVRRDNGTRQCRECRRERRRK